MAGSTAQPRRGAVGVVLMLVAAVALVAQRTAPGDHDAGPHARGLAAHRGRLRRASLANAVPRSSGADVRRDARGEHEGGSGAGGPPGKGGKGKGPKAPKPPQRGTTNAQTLGNSSPGKGGKGQGPKGPLKGKAPKAPAAGAGAGADDKPGNVTAGPKGGNAKGPKAGTMGNATAKGAKSPKGPGEGAKLGGNASAGPKGSKGKGAKLGNTTAKGPKAGKAGKTGNATSTPATAKGAKGPPAGKGSKVARNVTTMEVSLPMPPGDCEKQTAAEVKANVGVIANATGQAALLDLAASTGTCTAAASASSRARRATKDNFAVSLAFKDTVTPAQSASAVEATGAVIAAGNFSVSLGVGGAAKTVVMPKEANVAQGTRAAPVAEAGGSGPEAGPGAAEGSGAAATGGVAALLGVALAIAGLV